MPRPKRLPSGAWRIQAYYKDPVSGRISRPSFTAETQAEALAQYALFLQNHKERKIPMQHLTVGQAVDRYIAASQETLSPTTIEAYKRYREHAFPSLMDESAMRITDEDMQEAINREIRRKNERTGAPLSAKAVKNEYGLISAAMKTVCKRTFVVRLPKVQDRTLELPEPQAVAAAIKGSDIELPCLLAMWLSFSMSEIRGIRCSSVRGGKIYIERTVVTVNGRPVEKNTAKTATRMRSAVVPAYIMDLIRRQANWKLWAQEHVDGYLVPANRKSIHGKWTRLCKKHGFSLSFHGLRHMNASILLNILNAPKKTVQEKGGWKTNRVLDRNYSHEFSSVRKQVDAEMDSYMESLLK